VAFIKGNFDEVLLSRGDQYLAIYYVSQVTPCILF